MHIYTIITHTIIVKWPIIQIQSIVNHQNKNENENENKSSHDFNGARWLQWRDNTCFSHSGVNHHHHHHHH